MTPRAFPLCVLLAAASLPAQHHFREIAIEEVMADPFGPNAGAQQIEISTRNIPVDVTGYQLAIDTTLVPFPSLILPADRTITLNLGVPGAGPNQLFFPTAPQLLPNTGTIGIYRSTQISDPAEVVDYLAWGISTFNIDTAVQAGAWNSQIDIIPAVAEGSSIAYYGRSIAGPFVGPVVFYEDSTPTLGSPNDPASVFTLGGLCEPNGVRMLLATGDISTGPWIGETHTIIMQQQSGAVASMFLAFGWNRLSPFVLLDPIGAPGCVLGIEIVTVVNAGASDLNSQVSYSLGPDPVLVGFEYFVQGITTGLGTGVNPLGLVTSSPLVLTVGSR